MINHLENIYNTNEVYKMVNIEEIKVKVKRYLQEKHNLDVPSCYAICKDLTDDYWDEWRNADSEEIVNKEDFSEFEPQPLTMQSNIAQQQANPVPVDVKQNDLNIRVV
jgi:hypothetical protein